MHTEQPAGERMEPVIVGAADLRSDAEAMGSFTLSAHRLLAGLVRGGATIGWVDPPTFEEVADLVEHVFAACESRDGAVRAAYLDRNLVGLGYWLRYNRPTYRPHADLEKLAVDAHAQGGGIGRALTAALIADARAAGIEVLTLDTQGENRRALRVYESLGFVEYGRLPRFVSFGGRRYDRVCCMLDLRESRDPTN